MCPPLSSPLAGPGCLPSLSLFTESTRRCPVLFKRVANKSYSNGTHPATLTAPSFVTVFVGRAPKATHGAGMPGGGRLVPLPTAPQELLVVPSLVWFICRGQRCSATHLLLVLSDPQDIKCSSTLPTVRAPSSPITFRYSLVLCAAHTASSWPLT